jgi:tetratricopeptide (TPR) repeat protein
MSYKTLVLSLMIGSVAFTAAAQEPAQSPAPPTPTSVAVSPSGTAKSTASMTPRQVAELRADILVARKMYLQGIAAYEELLKTYPKDAGLLNKIGIAYQEMGASRDAARYYKQASKADHNFASPLNNLGTIEYEQKKYGKAVKLYQKALEGHGEAATVYSNLGYAYFALQQYPDAMNAFHQAVALDPKIFDRRGTTGSIVQQRTVSDPGLFYFFLAKSYAQAGDAEHCARYLKLARDDGYAQYTTAQSDPAFARVIHDSRVQELLRPAQPAPE